MRRRIVIPVAVAVAAGGLILSVRLHSDTARRRQYAQARSAHAPSAIDTLGTLPDVLRESSGLALGHRRPDVFWTHNDSGDDPRFFAIDGKARLLGTWDVAEADAVDWEAMDIGPCPAVTPADEAFPDTVSASCLYLADTGDNDRARDTLTVYVVAEPDAAGQARTVTPRGRLRFAYPDDRHDVEALAVDPDGDVILVTKGRTPQVLLYDLPAADVAEAVRTDRPLRVAPGRTLPIDPDWSVGRVVTGGSFHPTGRALAVRTYTEIFFFPWPLPDDLPADPPSCFLGDVEPQGEAVAWGPDGTLLLTSEVKGGKRGRLLRVRCPAADRAIQEESAETTARD